MPDWLVIAFGASAVRIQILKFALERGRIVASEVMAEYGLSRNGAQEHLSALTEAQLLTPGRMRFGSSRWSMCWVVERGRGR